MRLGERLNLMATTASLFYPATIAAPQYDLVPERFQSDSSSPTVKC